MEPRPSHQFDPFGPEAAAYDGPDLDLDGVDWNDPESFMKALGGGSGTNLPIPKHMSPKEVRCEGEARSKNVSASYDKLRKILERHELTIQKRWAKKTKQQRLKVLLDAWPSLATQHRPDFEAFARESEKERDAGTKYRELFIWPYINQEDLSKPKTLPLLLNARGRHLPSVFAGADSDTMHLGMVTKAIVPIFLNCHTMILHGVTNPKDYGKLVEWDEHPDAFEWAHSRKQFLPGEGLIVLEAQEKLLRFLVECCQEILHDIPAETLTDDKFPIQPEPHVKSDTDSTGFDSLAVMAAEAPYRVPARLDLDRVESLLAAKTTAVEDHLWALREDPSYFTETILDNREHRQEMLKDVSGDKHPTLKIGREGVLWARVIGESVSSAYLEVEIFSELLQQARELRSLKQKYEDTISPSKDLPKDYLGALLKFRYFLEQAVKGPLGLLRVAVVASAPMRKFFVREVPTDPNSTMITVTSKPGVKMNKTTQRLVWLLRTLWEDGKTLFFIRLPMVVDELERLVQSDKEASELVTAHIASIIGTLSIISQCIRQIELYQPWSMGFDMAFYGDWQDEIKSQFSERSGPWARVLAALKDKRFNIIAPLGNPSQNRFSYPFEKRRTRENVEVLQQAEKNLDAFWNAIDKLVYDKAGDLGGTAVRRILSQPRMVHRTPDWVEPAVMDKKKADIDVAVLNKPLSALFSGLQETPEEPGRSARSQPPAKVKVKTRGAPNVPASAPAEPPAEPGPDRTDLQPRFQVDARALKVFRSLFFNPEVSSTPGEVLWKDFLHAMGSTGFVAEKLYGSVWQFRPTRLDVERAIQFHEPHPSGKIPFTVARRHGRRLNRAYGWFGGMFTLKDKTGR